jgi:hypothetical protein
VPKLPAWIRGQQPDGPVEWVTFLSALLGIPAAILALSPFGTSVFGDKRDNTFRPPKSLVAITRADSEWDDKQHEGSHWGPLLRWSTTGEMTTCTLSDDQGSTPELVPTATKKTRRYFSYPGTVQAVTVRLHCDGTKAAEKSHTVVQPEGPALNPRLARASPSRWLHPPSKERWEAHLMYSGGSAFAVNCWLWDNDQRLFFHKDPSGAKPWYGDFAAAVATVKVRLKCINVANVEYFSPDVIVRRPAR